MAYDKLKISELTKGASLLFNRKFASIKAIIPEGYLDVLIDTSLSELAKSAYGDPEYAHILGIYNGITEDNVEAGKRVYYPSLDALNNLV